MGLPDDFDFSAFLDSIDENWELRGMRVVYYDGYEMTIIREGPPWCAADLKTIVIKPNLGETTLHSPKAAETRDGRMYSELLSAGLGCAGAVVGWAVVFGSAGAAPVTGGTSTFVTALAWTGAVSGSLQCANSMVRVWSEATDPHFNDMLDSQAWYTRTSAALDAISLIGAGASTVATLRMAKALQASTGKTMLAVLKGLTRQERKRIAEEAIRLQNPGITKAMLKRFVQAGLYPKRFTSEAVTHAIRDQLKDAIGAALSLVGSATSGLVRQAGTYVVGVAQSVETY
ncbi:MAG: hypothetical protein QM778_21555 [Myxococcales bacterium]